MDTAIKAIETHYNGYRFRSRLEARWAVFFDTLGIPYKYEYEGYDLDGLWYLPDFKMPLGGCGCVNWAEIKPHQPTSQECEKAIRLCLAKRQRVIVLAGDVWPDAYIGYIFMPIDPEEVEGFREVLDLLEPPVHWTSPTKAIWIVEEEAGIFTADLERCVISTNTFFVQCPKCEAVFLEHAMEGCKCDVEEYEHTSPFLRSAYVTARHARFEHGERGYGMPKFALQAKKQPLHGFQSFYGMTGNSK